MTSPESQNTMATMRTTIDLDDTLLKKARSVAKHSRISLRVAVNRALALGLDRMDHESRKTGYQATTFPMGVPSIPNLDKALHFAALLEESDFQRFAGLPLDTPLS
ncbi:MAG: hypothetical protein ABR538_09560 [Candidatus Binatia bacterium]